jgi:hypothetical protein
MQGLSELQAALRQLPEHLAREADVYVRRAAETTANQIQASYPVVSGALQRGVVVEHNSSKFGSASLVRSRAYHAHLYEFGSQVRQYLGANRGAMPAKPTVIPIAIRNRRELVRQLVRLVEQNGFEVSGG